MHKGERGFWADTVAAANPGWTVQLDPGWGKDGALFSNLNVFLYAYDTATGWKAACATSQQDMLKARRDLEASGSRRNAIKDACGSAICDAADQSATASDVLARQALMISMINMTDTRTFALVKEKLGDVTGHWLTIMYRLKDGTCLTRPAYAEGRAISGLMSPEQLAKWVREIVAADTGNTATSVYQVMQSAGGPKLMDAIV